MSKFETIPVPTVDFVRWAADQAYRRQMVQELDDSLRDTGMFLITGHGVPPELTASLRSLGRSFFRLPDERKARYAVRRPYDNGWRGLGLLAASAADGGGGVPDLHEAFHAGPTHRTGDAEFDDLYYPRNRWPADIPGLETVMTAYTGHMVRVAFQVLAMLATVLDIPEGFFTMQAQRATWTQNVNWYPSLGAVGAVRQGQMRVGPHSDFGTLSLLDRQPGVGGLEVWSERHVWTDGRWRALRHRVLPPSSLAPEEELVSLVFFFEADPDAVVTPLPPPVGGGCGNEAVVAGESILRKVGITLDRSRQVPAS